MSWFTSAASIDEQVEKATSESLPTGEQDLALNLEICDLIRSKSVAPKDAMRSLKRRLLHKNPNVQIATLHLVDVCIKNGGSHFLNEIASREFMDTIVVVLKPTSGSVNADVKELLLEYVQNWAKAFEGQIQLGYVNEVYKRLKDEGFNFPAATKINASFIDSSAPPEWVDSDTCMKSGEPFTLLNRRHHCRNCGGVFLQKYCNNYLPLPQFGINQPVRVCVDCYAKLRQTTKKNSSADSRPNIDSNTSQNNAPGDDDEDLRRAIQLSLEEAGNPNFLRSPQISKPAVPTPQPAPAAAAHHIDDDLDDDMKAAIEASLKDFQLHHPTEQPSNPPASNGLYNIQPVDNGSALDSSPSQFPVHPQYELTAVEAENINLFATLVDRLQTAPPGTILREAKIQELNESISALRPKVARTLADTISKYDKLVDMHGKLAAALRYYDQLLEERLSYTYNRRRSFGYAYDTQQPQSYEQQAQTQYEPQNTQPLSQPPQQTAYNQVVEPSYPPYPQDSRAPQVPTSYPPPPDVNSTSHPQPDSAPSYAEPPSYTQPVPSYPQYPQYSQSEPGKNQPSQPPQTSYPQYPQYPSQPQSQGGYYEPPTNTYSQQPTNQNQQPAPVAPKEEPALIDL